MKQRRCTCGCGKLAPAGRHWIPSHATRCKLARRGVGYKNGPDHACWKGGRRAQRPGYIRVWVGPNTDAQPEHRVEVGRALGSIIRGRYVARVFKDEPYERGNIVIAENPRYVNLLQMRARALRACGNPDYRWCWYCGTWDDPLNMKPRDKNRSAHHPECRRYGVRLFRERKTGRVVAPPPGEMWRRAAIAWVRDLEADKQRERELRKDRRHKPRRGCERIVLWDAAVAREMAAKTPEPPDVSRAMLG